MNTDLVGCTPVDLDDDFIDAVAGVAQILQDSRPSKGNGGFLGAYNEAAEGPIIYADTPDLPTITSLCWKAIVAANAPPRFFRHGGVLCRLEQDELGKPVPIDLTRDRMRYELARLAEWRKRQKPNEGAIDVGAKPPLDVVRDVLATPDPPLPVLSRIVGIPVFAPDGTLLLEPGYHAKGRVFYFPDGVLIPDVPEVPSGDDVRRARGILLELFVDFPFVSDADLAHAIALLILPFVRDMIDGPTPNHLVEAPSPGSGKGLLVDVSLFPAMGNNVGLLSEVRDESELRKRITALLRSHSPAIVMDNVTRHLDSGVWSAALTAGVWADRILGRSEDVRLPVRSVWVTTGNNVTMTTEIARRCVRIRLDPKCDRPWKREGFVHGDLRGWVRDNRGDIVWAALTLVSAWIRAGRPVPSIKPLGSFESWSQVMGGILDVGGIGGFLDNADEFYEQADTEGGTWRAFVARWHGEFGEGEVGTKELFPIASDFFPLGDGSERSQRTRLGKILAKQRDRVVGDFQVVAGGILHSAQLWKVLRKKNV